jgi:hypothetical protein
MGINIVSPHIQFIIHKILSCIKHSKGKFGQLVTQQQADKVGARLLSGVSVCGVVVPKCPRWWRRDCMLLQTCKPRSTSAGHACACSLRGVVSAWVRLRCSRALHLL